MLDERDVGSREIDPAVAGPLRRSRGDDDQIRGGAHLDVIAAMDPAASDELQPVAEIERLRSRPGAVDVVERDLVRQALDRRRVSNGRADAAGTDHRPFA